MVGCEKPKKSAPDGTMGATGLELKREECLIITGIITMYCYFFLFYFLRFSFEVPVPDGCNDLQEVGVARQGGRGHNCALRIVLRHNLKLGARIQKCSLTICHQHGGTR